MDARLTIAALIVGGLVLGGCATASNCAGWQPINPSRADTLTDGTQSQILSHNLQGVEQGCWSAPR